MKRILLVASGLLSLGLGILGIFLPLLPTTVFLLIAAACFLRSSPAFYRRLMTHRVLGAYILSYTRYRAITRGARITSLVMLWAAILTSSFVVAEALWLRLLLLGIAVGVSLHLLLLKGLTPEMRDDIRAEIAKMA